MNSYLNNHFPLHENHVLTIFDPIQPRVKPFSSCLPSLLSGCNRGRWTVVFHNLYFLEIVFCWCWPVSTDEVYMPLYRRVLWREVLKRKFYTIKKKKKIVDNIMKNLPEGVLWLIENIFWVTKLFKYDQITPKDVENSLRESVLINYVKINGA